MNLSLSTIFELFTNSGSVHVEIMMFGDKASNECNNKVNICNIYWLYVNSYNLERLISFVTFWGKMMTQKMNDAIYCMNGKTVILSDTLIHFICIQSVHYRNSWSNHDPANAPDRGPVLSSAFSWKNKFCTRQSSQLD